MDGGLLVVNGAALPKNFFTPAGFNAFDAAGHRPRNRITTKDIEILNKVMKTRSPYELWEPVLRARHRWLAQIDPDLDLIRTSDQRWKAARGEMLLRRALEAWSGTDEGAPLRRSCSTSSDRSCSRSSTGSSPRWSEPASRQDASRRARRTPRGRCPPPAARRPEESRGVGGDSDAAGGDRDRPPIARAHPRLTPMVVAPDGERPSDPRPHPLLPRATAGTSHGYDRRHGFSAVAITRCQRLPLRPRRIQSAPRNQGFAGKTLILAPHRD
jgi:hypothetical protein